MKKFLCLLIALILTFELVNSAFCAHAEGITVKVDGKSIDFGDGKPFVNEDNRLLVPIRAIGTAMEANIKWCGIKHIATVEKGRKIEIYIDDDKILIDGKQTTTDTRAVMKDDTIYLPLRFIAETFGSEVRWTEKTSMVDIKTKQ